MKTVGHRLVQAVASRKAKMACGVSLPDMPKDQNEFDTAGEQMLRNGLELSRSQAYVTPLHGRQDLPELEPVYERFVEDCLSRVAA